MYTRGCACTGRSSRHQSPLGAKVDLSGWSHDQGGWVGMKMREPGGSLVLVVLCVCVCLQQVCVCVPLVLPPGSTCGVWSGAASAPVARLASRLARCDVATSIRCVVRKPSFSTALKSSRTALILSPRRPHSTSTQGKQTNNTPGASFSSSRDSATANSLRSLLFVSLSVALPL